ncbi:MAG: YdcH family protein [Magnetococcales bacterium]|nr:YdcH family protein [Magnetococcales bacterium]
MFEDQLAAVQELLDTNAHFRDLHERHAALKDKVAELNESPAATYDTNLERMKKEKLVLKDQMAAILANYTRR